MKRRLAALIIATAAFGGFGLASAQDAAPPPQATDTPDALSTQDADLSAFQEILETDLPPETMQLALQLVRLSGIGRTFDELLPNIASQAKNAFIRANPQMQLGIIEMVDRTALTLVSRRRELDENLAKVWASGFTVEEMRELVEFYSSPTGQKYADLNAELLSVEMAAAQHWARSVNDELTQKVADELRASVAAEGRVLQGGGDVVAEPPAAEPAPAQ